MSELLIETFEEIETDPTNPTKDKFEEFDNEFPELIEKLSLDGQKKLIGKGDSETKRATPYGTVDVALFNAIEFLFNKVEIEKYDLSPIPTRVLQIYEYASSLGVYSKFYIYHSKSLADPFLIGRIGTGWDSNYHLLARWGTELIPIPEIIDKAREKTKKEWINKLIEIKSIVDAKLNQVDRESFEINDLKIGSMPSLYMP